MYIEVGRAISNTIRTTPHAPNARRLETVPPWRRRGPSSRHIHQRRPRRPHLPFGLPPRRVAVARVRGRGIRGGAAAGGDPGAVGAPAVVPGARQRGARLVQRGQRLGGVQQAVPSAVLAGVGGQGGDETPSNYPSPALGRQQKYLTTRRVKFDNRGRIPRGGVTNLYLLLFYNSSKLTRWSSPSVAEGWWYVMACLSIASIPLFGPMYSLATSVPFESINSLIN